MVCTFLSSIALDQSVPKKSLSYCKLIVCQFAYKYSSPSISHLYIHNTLKTSWLDFVRVLRFSFPVAVAGPSAKDFYPLQRAKFTGGIFLLFVLFNHERFYWCAVNQTRSRHMSCRPRSNFLRRVSYTFRGTRPSTWVLLTTIAAVTAAITTAARTCDDIKRRENRLETHTNAKF